MILQETSLHREQRPNKGTSIIIYGFGTMCNRCIMVQ